MNLKDLGYHPRLEQHRKENRLEELITGRVIAEHKERYLVATDNGVLEAEITGNLRYSATGRADFPVVGDWVALMVFDDSPGIIHSIYPRASLIKRQKPGATSEFQPIAANVDHGWIVQALDRDFNLNRMERYLAICHSSGVNPVILLTKADLVSEPLLGEYLDRVRQRVGEIPVIALSNKTLQGMDALKRMIRPGETYCMLGSSGVGKSTLLNQLAGTEVMKTISLSQQTGKGRHTTSHRELMVLEGGGIIIDNPGMREVGITGDPNGLESAFELIDRLAEECRYRDCTHTGESGCKVLKALEEGTLDPLAYENYRKMEKERAYVEATLEEKRRKDKAFGKMVKKFKKYKNS